MLAVSKGFFQEPMLKGSQPTTTAGGVTSSIRTHFAANANLEDTEAVTGDWADEEAQILVDDDDAILNNASANQEEKGEGWGDDALELPPDMVSQ